jgi:antitoxin ParD1/3/4
VPTRNINLTDHFDQFVADEIEAGRYRNASEVLRAGLRLLELQKQEEREKLKLLRSLASESFAQLDQGRGIEIRGERQLADLVRRTGRRATSSAKRRQGE